MKIDNSQGKTCPKCLCEYPLALFHKDKSRPDGHSTKCGACRRAEANARYPKNKEKKKAYAKAYHATHRPDYLRRLQKWRAGLSPVERKNLDLQRTHGISLEQFWEMLFTQRGQCKLCKRIPKTPLVVDHCHATGKVRGLLCQACNSALGKLQDSTDILLRAILYLKGEL